jgi:hypothetical protein
MGMRSYLDNYEVKIINLEGLKQYIEFVKEQNKPDDWLDCIEIEGDYLRFEGIDEHKIISYWYTEFVEFLRDLAIYVEGYVNLTFENNAEGGWFEFREGLCTIHAGNMEWTKFTPEEMRPEIKPLNKKLKGDLFARKL